MITRDILVSAKQYLCWDRYEDLTIQFIEVSEPVSYFFPPASERATILLFLKSANRDCREALFLLFHEVGHYLQYRAARAQNPEAQYRARLELDGARRAAFEEEAWNMGVRDLEAFLRELELPREQLLSEYRDYAERSIATYN